MVSVFMSQDDSAPLETVEPYRGDQTEAVISSTRVTAVTLA